MVSSAPATVDAPSANLASPDGLESLRQASDHGDTRAMARLAARLLVGANAPRDPRGAFTLLSAAAERDDIDAIALLATLAAVGATAPPDWPTALSLIRRAAALGSPPARAQLLLLATGSLATPNDSESPDTWGRLAEKVDVTAWITPPPRQALFEAPRVRMAARFATAPVCDWIRHKAEGRMRPAMMYHGDSKTERIDPHRTCGDYQFDILNTDLVLLLVRERIAALTKLPTVAMEPPRVFHYALGQEIKPHYDRCGDGALGYGGDTGYLGDRIVTFLLYLNDDFEGGDLDFPKAGFRCKGAKGDAVYFAHVDMAGKPDPLSLHAGLKISRGEKWVLSQWIHDRPFGVATRPAA
jgi:prolyl 4-hydroxylase